MGRVASYTDEGQNLKPSSLGKHEGAEIPS